MVVLFLIGLQEEEGGGTGVKYAIVEALYVNGGASSINLERRHSPTKVFKGGR